MKSLTQVFLAFLIIVKILLGSILIYHVEWDSFSLKSDAVASEIPKESKGDVKKVAGTTVKKKVDLKYLMEKRAELDQKEEELAKKRSELMAIQEDINNRIAKLTQLRNEIRAEMAKKKAREEKDLKHLIKVYTAMKPKKAASLIEKLDIQFAIKLLSKMKGDVVGQILSSVDIERAARISEGLAKRR